MLQTDSHAYNPNYHREKNEWNILREKCKHLPGIAEIEVFFYFGIKSTFKTHGHPTGEIHEINHGKQIISGFVIGVVEHKALKFTG